MFWLQFLEEPLFLCFGADVCPTQWDERVVDPGRQSYAWAWSCALMNEVMMVNLASELIG